jgi:hypothetical protein
MRRMKLKMTKKFSVNKTKIATIALTLTLTISAVLLALPITTAQFDVIEQPPLVINIPSFLFVTASPNPVGVDQIVYIGATFSKPMPTNNGQGGDYYDNVTIEIVDPTGHKTVLGPTITSMAAGITETFTPNQVGEYTIQAFYPGQILTGTHRGGSSEPSGWSIHLLGSWQMPTESEIVTLIVQEDKVGPIYQTPSLPDEYWTRPIYATNWDWGRDIGSNWFGSGVQGNVQPYGIAPNTAHIVWSKSTHFGGQPGGPIASDESTQYSSTSLLTSYFTPTTILNGILYYNKYAGLGSSLLGWEAVDIRTGETVWSKSAGVTGTESISRGQVVNFNNFQEFGSAAFLWSQPGGGGFMGGGASWNGLYDAYTGEFLANVTNPVSGTMMIDESEDTFLQGAIIGYSASGGTLNMVNTTILLAPPSFFGGSTFVRPAGTIDGSAAVQWSVSIPTTLNGVPISLSVAAVTPDVILLREVPGSLQWQGTTMGFQITAGVDPKTGDVIWGPFNQTLPPYEDTSLVAARDGYYVLHNKDRNQAYGYSLTNGKQLWGPVQMEGSGWSPVYRGGEIAYGKVYIFDLGGYVTAIDLESGEIAWNFTRGSSGYDTPFGIYPIFGYSSHSVADGKLFLSEGIMYTPPLHPSRSLVLNCTDGSLVWSISLYSSTSPGAIADGYFVDWNSFDCKIYSFGKGPTQTTVEAPLTGVTQGSSVVIRGTVMDTSAGTEQEGVIERFSNGVPAVSDESMREWMEYVYMQQNFPSDVEGVKVFVKILDPNDEWYSTIVTTDSNGVFSHSWAPSIVGDYHVTAMFEGSESYYTSYSTTTFTVDEAQVADVPSAAEIAQTTVNQMPSYPAIPEIPAYLTIDIVILVIAAVGVVIGLIAYMALRKQK